MRRESERPCGRIGSRENGERQVDCVGGTPGLILFLSSALIVLVDPDAASLLAVSLIFCVMNPGKGGGRESGCNGQANECQQKSLHGSGLLRKFIRHNNAPSWGKFSTM
jgi:hypothetical protein